MTALNPEAPQIDNANGGGDRFAMTFDEAFNEATAQAVYTTVPDKPRTWLQRLGLLKRGRWKPTPSERIKAIESCRERCRLCIVRTNSLPAESDLREVAQQAIGVGPLTLLWIAAMVATLLNNLHEWWNREPKGQERQC